MKDSILIREWIPETNQNEMETLVPAYLSIWNDPENLKFLSFSGKLFEEAQIRSWFSNHQSRGIQYFVAIDKSSQSVAGIMIVGRAPTSGINLGGIGVLPKYKGMGIGKLLVSKCIEQAKFEGFKAIDTEVFANNFRMIRLIVGCEFIPIKMDYHRGCDGADLLQFKKYL